MPEVTLLVRRENFSGRSLDEVSYVVEFDCALLFPHPSLFLLLVTLIVSIVTVIGCTSASNATGADRSDNRPRHDVNVQLAGQVLVSLQVVRDRVGCASRDQVWMRRDPGSKMVLGEDGDVGSFGWGEGSNLADLRGGVAEVFFGGEGLGGNIS